MPVLIPIVAAIAASAIAASPAIIAALGVIGAAALGAGVATAFSFVSAALAPKPKGAGQGQSFVQQQRQLTVMVRSSVEPRRIIYGEARVSGPVVFAEVASRSGTNHTKQFLQLVVPLAGHQCQAINEVYLGDSIAWYDSSNNTVWRTIHDSAGDNGGANNAGYLFTLGKHLGADDQAADSTLVSRGTSWTTNHRLRGVTYLWVELREDPTVWTAGVPNVSAVTQGRLVYDPRSTAIAISSSAVGVPGLFTTGSSHGVVAGDRVFIDSHSGVVPTVAKEFQIGTAPSGTTLTLLGNDGSGSIGESLTINTGGSGGTLTKMLWSDNAALAVLDYLLNPLGFNCDLDEIDVDSFTAGANTSDEMVALTDTSDTFTADASTDICARSTLTVPMRRGDGVQVSTTGTLPTGLSAATTYYYIPTTPTISETAPTAGQITGFNFKLATSLANARAGTAINITGAGSGTHTITRKSQPRYTTNGVISLDVAPIEVLKNLLSACAGTVVYTQGQFRLSVGVYASPAVSLDEDDLRGEVTLRTKVERRELFNTVRGTFIDPDNSYQASDFPQITDATFKSDDGGEEIARDVEFPFSNDLTLCQRLAKITLLRGRTGGQGLIFPAKLTALRVAPGDVVSISLSKLGLVAAPFLVTDWRLSDDLGVDLTLSAIDSDDFAWTAAEAATATRPATLSLIDASAIPAPGLSLSQDTVATGAGDTIARMTVTLTAPSSAVIEGYEVEYKLSTDTNYSVLGTGTLLIYVATGVKQSVTYDVRARSVSGTGAKSSYATASIAIDAPATGATLWDSVAGNIDSWGAIDSL